MTRIEKYGVFCRSWEGGWSNNPNDSGGATMMGITYKTFCNYRKEKKKSKPTLDDLKKITIKEWNEILRWGYWNKIQADKIKDEWVAYIFVDWVWMSGTRYIKLVQRRIGVTDDGIIGPKSLAKMNSMDGKELFNLIWKERETHFKRIGTGKNASFLKGWLRRLNSIKYGKLVSNGGGGKSINTIDKLVASLLDNKSNTSINDLTTFINSTMNGNDSSIT